MALGLMIDLGPDVSDDVAAAIVEQIPPGYDIEYQPAKRGPGGQERWRITYDHDGRIWSTRTPVLAGIIPAVLEHVQSEQPTHLPRQAERARRDQQIRDADRAGTPWPTIAARHGILPLDVGYIVEAGRRLERTTRRPVFREAPPVESVETRPGVVRRRVPWRRVDVRFTPDDEVPREGGD